MPTLEELRERLRRPLMRELSAGCEDRVVAGGVAKLLINLGGPFPRVRELLRDYGQLDPAARRECLEKALVELEARGRVAQTSTETDTRTDTRAGARTGTQTGGVRERVQPSVRRAPTKEKSAPVETFVLETELASVAFGPGGAKKLSSLGLRTVRDLLHNYPRRYEDRRALPGVEALEEGQKATIAGVIVAKTRYQPRKGMLILKVTLRDEWGQTVGVSWFNQPWVEKSLREGNRLIVTGRAKRFGRRFELGAEYFEVEESGGPSLSTGRIIGVYGATEGVSQDFIRRAVGKVLDAAIDVPDWLSSVERGRLGLIPLAEALSEVHRPSDETKLEHALARLRFDEFLFLELRMLLQGEGPLLGKRFRAVPEAIEEFEASLPFRFTNAQRRAILEIADDMRSERQMARLLQGDVGSGKTAVAACALYLATRDGYQGALMAPTEILARQHFANFLRYLSIFGLRIELLMGAMTARERAEARVRISQGESDIVVGTQALIQDGVEFANLGLAVIDEEHRFGVLQRRALLRDRPDVLVMSATPIPRSLALTAYGDLELTVIDELPPGRTPIATKLLTDTQRRQAYAFVLGQIREGRQAYVVAPLVEESEKLSEILAATQLADDLRLILPEVGIELLHGRMNAVEKDEVMTRFRTHEFDLLVSTTVIEVGVDVPNATVIVIENAERFGLSQLHQLRGRVGRGAARSYCVLIAGEHSKKTRERLQVIERSTDGFEIAEADLRLRGPGELKGTRQSGLDELRLGDLSRDVAIIEQAREFAKSVLGHDPYLTDPHHATLRLELQLRAETVAVRDVI